MKANEPQPGRTHRGAAVKANEPHPERTHRGAAVARAEALR